MKQTNSVLAAVLISFLAGVCARGQTHSPTPLTAMQQAAQTTAVRDFDHGNFAAALPIFTKLAAVGDARSETDLGRMYYHGWGVAADQDQAFELLSQAVAQHYGRAEDVLGGIYQYHAIDDKAYYWYSRAAQDGYAPGEAHLGVMYRYGIGVAIDYGQARHWDEAAAAQEDGVGYNGLGDIYYSGLGGGDLGETVAWPGPASARSSSSRTLAIIIIQPDIEPECRPGLTDRGERRPWLIYTSKHAAFAFGDQGGSIINISSVNDISPVPGGAVYSATKAAVNAITVSLARELGPKSIRVNAVAPGLTMTERYEVEVPEQPKKHVIGTTPLGRLGTPQDIVGAASFLASDSSAWVTGQVIAVAGGAT